MLRALSLLLLLSLSACSKSDTSGDLATIEDAESYAQARGVVLTEKKEDTDQAVAPRAYNYMHGAVKVGITQFASTNAAATWKKLVDDTPLGTETIVVKGSVAFSIWGATDAERQKVIGALK